MELSHWKYNMIYALKRIQNVLQNKQVALNIATALYKNNHSLLTKENREIIEDILHSDYGMLQYVKSQNMFILTLNNGEELTNTNYISHMLVFSVEEHGGGEPVLNIDAGCGVVYMSPEIYTDHTAEFKVVNFTFRPSISIRIDFDEMELAERFDDSHVEEQEYYQDNFDTRRKQTKKQG